MLSVSLTIAHPDVPLHSCRTTNRNDLLAHLPVEARELTQGV